jgi:hypothetical protein
VKLRARREDLLVVAACGLFAAGLCFLRPTVFESLDYVQYWRPTFQFLADTVRAGVLPLWNPYVGLGRPFLADMQNAVFYPPVYLVCLGQEAGVFLLVWLHCVLGIFGMRRLGSALGTGRWQSYFMGVSYLASGELTARWMTGQITYCWELCYLPWLFYHALRTSEPWQARRLAQYALCLALQFLCGHPQVFWVSLLGQGAFILVRALRLPPRAALRDAGQGIVQFGAACAWCAGLVAPVLLPMLELVSQGNRSGATPDFTNSFRLDWVNLRYLFHPLHAGDINWESNLFAGTIVVVLGLAGLCRLRDRNARGLLGVLVIGLLIAAGRNTPLFALFYQWLPGFAGFRIHARAAVLIVFALICAAGMWLGWPHPRLRAWWERSLGLPLRYAVFALVLLQMVDLVQGTWMIKRVYSYAAIMILHAPAERSFEQTLAHRLREAGGTTPGQPPLRVCAPPSLVPANYGMIHHYANFDANCSLFLRRPWDYLHAVLGISPPMEKGSLSPQVYARAPFPYQDVSLALGWDPREGKLVAAAAVAPRAFVVYNTEVADYDTMLQRLANGYPIHQEALLDQPLPEPLAAPKSTPAGPASIRWFAPNSLLVDVDVRGRGLLVLAEAWYPGWRAELEGKVSGCVPANGWMRAVPVPAGRHQVRLYFHQNYLLPGLLISLVSIGLVLAAVRWSRSPPAPPGSPAVSPTAAGTGSKPRAPRLSGAPAPAPGSRLPARGLVAGAMILCLLTFVEVRRWRGFVSEAHAVEAETQCYTGLSLHAQHQIGQAVARYEATLRLKPDHVMALCNLGWIKAAYPQAEFRDGPEAVRLAQRACELTRYQAPVPLETLAAAYAEAGHFNEALATAKQARQLALAAGQPELVDRPARMIKLFTERQPCREADRN